MKILLFTQFYEDILASKHKLNLYSLQNNIDNNNIDEIYCLNEKIYNHDILKNNKIKQYTISTRLKYSDVFDFIIKNNLINDSNIIIISNLDISFDHSLNNIHLLNLDKIKICYCLTRWETFKNTQEKLNIPELYYNKYNASTDTWIMHSNFITDKLILYTKFMLGTIGCENLFQNGLAKNDFFLKNDPYTIKSYHNDNIINKKQDPKMNFSFIISYKKYPYNCNVPNEEHRQLLRKYITNACEVPTCDSRNNMYIGIININKEFSTYLIDFFNSLNCKVDIIHQTNINNSNSRTLYIKSQRLVVTPMESQYLAKYDKIIVCDNNQITFSWGNLMYSKNSYLKKRIIILTPSIIRNYKSEYIYDIIYKKKFNAYNTYIPCHEIFKEQICLLKEKITNFQFHIAIVSFGGCAMTYLLNILKDNKVSVMGNSDKHLKSGTSISNWSEKHGSPYSPIYQYYDRIIYLTGDPILAILSHYRRKWPHIQYKKLYETFKHILMKWNPNWTFDINLFFRDCIKAKCDLYGNNLFFKYWLHYANNMINEESKKIYFHSIETLSLLSDDEISQLFYNEIKTHTIKINVNERHGYDHIKIPHHFEIIHHNTLELMKNVLKNKIVVSTICRFYSPVQDLIFTTRYKPKNEIQKDIPFYFNLFTLVIDGYIDRVTTNFDYMFCAPHLLHKLLKIIENNLSSYYNYKRILVIQGEDRPHLSEIHIDIRTKLKKFCTKIFMESKDIIDDDIFLMPCGFTEHYIRNMKEDLFFKISKNEYNKKYPLRVLMSFGKFWNHNNMPKYYYQAKIERNKLQEEKNDFVDYKVVEREDYWQLLYDYGFLICPIGNAISTPKFTEAICMNVIPICFNHFLHREMRDKLDYPIIIIDKLSEIHYDNLVLWKKQYYQKISLFKKKMTTNYIHHYITS